MSAVGNLVRMQDVVGAEQVHPLAPAGGDHRVGGSTDALVFLPLQHDAAEAVAVRLEVAAGDFQRVVLRAVVDQHQFQFGIGLRADRGEAGLDEGGVVVGGNRDADEREGHPPIPPPKEGGDGRSRAAPAPCLWQCRPWDGPADGTHCFSASSMYWTATKGSSRRVGMYQRR